MKATASPRSLRRVDRPGAGGVADVSCTGCSFVALMCSASQPAATGVQHGLLLAGDLVERVLRILGAVESRVHVGVLDVDETCVLGYVPHVPEPGDRVGVDLVVRRAIEELR